MVDEVIIVAVAPFYAMGVYAAWWGMNYGQHMLRRVDQSATETRDTETVDPIGYVESNEQSASK